MHASIFCKQGYEVYAKIYVASSCMTIYKKCKWAYVSWKYMWTDKMRIPLLGSSSKIPHYEESFYLEAVAK